ncbi:hypothetical protein RJ639_046979 [Escallonia herrerae]|uniref:Sterol methyltransferase C-terminal domain-containing protein n=1 Tax=Escallonia herrerae TaxID=1293975 RepID=A0AA88W2Z1_9ASTE|nr:hypothetical protein RJ639_046979 [Escallonia herrerae]
MGRSPIKAITSQDFLPSKWGIIPGGVDYPFTGGLSLLLSRGWTRLKRPFEVAKVNLRKYCICLLGEPGQRFGAYEWCMTDSFDLDNQEHRKIKADIEIGNGLPDIRLTGQCLDAVKQAGFDVRNNYAFSSNLMPFIFPLSFMFCELLSVIWEKDVVVGAHVSWYAHLDKNESQSSFRLSTLGRFITENMVWVLECVGVAPKGSKRVSAFLENAAEGLLAGGKGNREKMKSSTEMMRPNKMYGNHLNMLVKYIIMSTANSTPDFPVDMCVVALWKMYQAKPNKFGSCISKSSIFSFGGRASNYKLFNVAPRNYQERTIPSRQMSGY